MTDEREIHKDPTLRKTRWYDKINPEQLTPKEEPSNVDQTGPSSSTDRVAVF